MIKNEKRKFKIYTDAISLVLLIATLLWMALIFYMSSQTGEASSFLSGSLSEGLAKLADSIFRGSAPPKLLELFRNERILRKSGHVFEYLVLGIFVYSWVRRQGTQGIQAAQGSQGTQGLRETRVSPEAQGSQGARGNQEVQVLPEAQGTQGVRGNQEAQASREEQVSPEAQASKAARVSKIITRIVRLLPRKVAVSILICVIYAATDEIHQILVPGRGPMIADTLLDSLSSTVGVLLVRALARDRRSEKRQGRRINRHA